MSKISMYQAVSDIIREKFGNHCAEEVIGLTTSLEDSVEEFIQQFSDEIMTPLQLANEYISWCQYEDWSENAQEVGPE